MLKDIDYSIAKLIIENPLLLDLLEFLIKEANFLGQKGKSISKPKINLVPKNYLALRFSNEASIEWEEHA
jgi:hypothetical protein